MIAPVAESGSCPSWIARVSKSIGHRLDEFCVEPACEILQRALHRVRATFPPGSEDAQHPGPAIVERLDPPDDAVAPQDRQDVVAVLALCLRDVHLEAVEEVPEGERAVAVVDQAVEGGQEGDARGRHRTVDGVRMRQQAPAPKLDAERPESLVLELPLRLCPRDSLRLWVPALGEVPQALLPAPSDDGDLAHR